MRRLALVLAVVAVVMVILTQPAGAAFPGTNGRIAATEGDQIVTVLPDGTGLFQATQFVWPDYGEAPQVSPNGRWIVFDARVTQSRIQGNVWTDLYKIRMNGADLTRLTTDRRSEWGASWSPNGRRIVYSRNNKYGTIWVMKANGDNAHMLVNRPGDSPRYSPNGKKIAYWSSIDNQIRVMRADGSQDRMLTSNVKWCRNSYPDWSPDGKEIVFLSDCTGTNQIWIMNADGSDAAQLTTVDPPGVTGAPVFSPDGKLVAFGTATNYCGVVNGICTVTLADMTLSPVASGPGGWVLGWQPIPGG